MHSWDAKISESWKWAELLVGIDQALCFWRENCSKPNVLNLPQWTFPRQEGQQLVNCIRKLPGTVSQRIWGEVKAWKQTHMRYCLPMALYDSDSLSGDMKCIDARTTVRRLAGSSAKSSGTRRIRIISKAISRWQAQVLPVSLHMAIDAALTSLFGWFIACTSKHTLQGPQSARGCVNM